MKRFKLNVAVLAGALLLSPEIESSGVIRHPEAGVPEGRNVYQIQLLSAALEATVATHGGFQLLAVPEMPQEREIRTLVNGAGLDVLWTVTSDTRESVMLPIRFPVLRGMLGHRICLVHETIPAPQKKADLIIGSGATWPDTDVFIANDFLVEPSGDYFSILRMLKARRINCFPRGLSEVDLELAAFAMDELQVDPSLSFLYFAPMYFFVARDNPGLAKRIEAGLELIVASGQFHALFDRFFEPDRLMQKYQMGQRSAACLDNPVITADQLAALRPLMIQGAGTFVDQCLDQ